MAVALALAVAFGALLQSGPALAGDGPGDGEAVLSVELNALEQVDAACRVTFVAGNALGAGLDAVSFEVVTFDGEGRVQRLTVFDFGALPFGRQRVRQFELAGTECGSIGRILVNGVADCAGEGLGPEACAAGLKLLNRTEIEFVG